MSESIVCMDPSGGNAMSGYTEGPTLHHHEHPWWLWEQDVRIDDGHGHEWERCLLLADGPQRWRSEEIVRCAVCHAPRCGDVSDADPCMERRHHDSLHIYLSGRFEPKGGYLSQTEADQ